MTVFDLDALFESAERHIDWSGGVERSRRARAKEGHTRSRASWLSGAHSTLLDKPVCAIDGEGKSRPNGRHDYCLLCAVWGPTASMRRCIERHRMTSEECLDFILDLPEGYLYLGYGLSYDTNMWLLGWPNDVIDHLLQEGEWQYKQYKIKWVERKFFTVRAYGKTRTVYDVLAFFQVPFVSPNPLIVKGACDAWLPERAADLEFVRVMKDLRGQFQKVDDAEIQRYTYIECELLIELMTKFIAALRPTGLHPRGLYGPGALAAAAYEKYGIKQFMAPLDEPMATLARTAYFGGRFDAAVFGWLEDCYQFDIHSAYPHQIRSLPCLKHSTFVHKNASFDTLNPGNFGLYHVEWAIDPASRWGPFPHRTSKGLIFYPYDGAGWYHAEEVRAAITMYGSDAVRVTEGWLLERRCDHVPFDFVVSLYALRQKLEREGNHDQGVIIKLLLNSLYGKLAQQVGTRKNQPPPFQCFFWAGAITAGTRAQILRVLASWPDEVLSIATDGLVATSMLDLDFGEELGEWESKPLVTFAQLSNGVYHAVDRDGKTIDRARGLGRGVLDFSKKASLYKHWKRTKGSGIYHYKGKMRFITHREASDRLDRNDVKCRWIEEARTLDFAPKRRFPWPTSARMRVDQLDTVLYSYADYGADRESQPFRVKTDAAEVHALRDAHQGAKWYNEP